jgi:hypothetical protein
VQTAPLSSEPLDSAFGACRDTGDRWRHDRHLGQAVGSVVIAADGCIQPGRSWDTGEFGGAASPIASRRAGTSSISPAVQIPKRAEADDLVAACHVENGLGRVAAVADRGENPPLVVADLDVLPRRIGGTT